MLRRNQAIERRHNWIIGTAKWGNNWMTSQLNLGYSEMGLRLNNVTCKLMKSRNEAYMKQRHMWCNATSQLGKNWTTSHVNRWCQTWTYSTTKWGNRWTTSLYYLCNSVSCFYTVYKLRMKINSWNFWKLKYINATPKRGNILTA